MKVIYILLCLEKKKNEINERIFLIVIKTMLSTEILLLHFLFVNILFYFANCKSHIPHIHYSNIFKIKVKKKKNVYK